MNNQNANKYKVKEIPGWKPPFAIINIITGQNDTFCWTRIDAEELCDRKNRAYQQAKKRCQELRK